MTESFYLFVVMSNPSAADPVARIRCVCVCERKSMCVGGCVCLMCEHCCIVLLFLFFSCCQLKRACVQSAALPRDGSVE